MKKKQAYHQKLLLTLIAGSSALALAACDVDKTEEGEMPEVDVDVEEGNLPEYDVEGPDVDVGSTEVEVPTLEVEVPDEEDDEPQE